MEPGDKDTSKHIPMVPEGVDVHGLLKGVHWHQKWEIFQEVYIPGINPVGEILDALEFPRDLSGKRVLDIGAWNGCFSFECERRGASEVIAVSLEDPDECGFNRLKKALNSKVQYVEGSAYKLSPEQIGMFDVVLFLGVLYHLRYPLLAIDRISSVTKGEVFIETHIIDYSLPLRWRTKSQIHLRLLNRLGIIPRILKTTPVWRQYVGNELQKDRSNWFGPNIVAVIESFQTAGLECWLVGSHAQANRGYFRAKPNKKFLNRLLNHSCEGFPVNVDLTGLSYEKNKE